MQQSKFLFFAIIGLAVVVVIGMVLARPLLPDQPVPLPAAAQAVSIRVAVAPSIRPWAEQAARAFSQQEARIQVQVVEVEGLVPGGLFTTNPQVTSPAGWLAEASFVVDLAREEGLDQFGAAVPVAESALAWGTFNDKQASFEQVYGPVSWDSIHAKGTAPADPLNLVMTAPDNSAEGLAVLISAAAVPLNRTVLSAADVRQSEPWLVETFQDNTRLLPRPAEAFATQGRSVGDVGLLSLVTWRRARLPERTDFSLTPLQPAVVLNYPLVTWTGAPPAEQAAVEAFRNFLLSEPQQQTLADFFLDRPGTASPGVQADGEAVQALLRWAERTLR